MRCFAVILLSTLIPISASIIDAGKVNHVHREMIITEGTADELFGRVIHWLANTANDPEVRLENSASGKIILSSSLPVSHVSLKKLPYTLEILLSDNKYSYSLKTLKSSYVLDEDEQLRIDKELDDIVGSLKESM
ncbi:MAG TPA: DUF4468 domain-containing protein [Fulvivirga sp.]|nr:DUF4468 domain-containing protein [Fulvivirga sp.]